MFSSSVSAYDSALGVLQARRNFLDVVSELVSAPGKRLQGASSYVMLTVTCCSLRGMEAQDTDLGTLLTTSINSGFLVLTCIRAFYIDMNFSRLISPNPRLQPVGAEQSRNEKSISEELWYIFGINEYIQRLDNKIFIYITSKVVIIVLWPRETSSDNIPREEDPDGESSILGVPNTFS